MFCSMNNYVFSNKQTKPAVIIFRICLIRNGSTQILIDFSAVGRKYAAISRQEIVLCGIKTFLVTEMNKCDERHVG